MRRSLGVILAVCLPLFWSAPLGAADTPSPTRSAARPRAAAKPLRVVMQVSDAHPGTWMLALSNIRNAQKDVGTRNIEVELVAYGAGLDMLRDDSVVANEVQQAMASGARFVACRNTMEGQHITEAEMIAGIGYVQAGAIEIVRKQMEGYAYLRP